MVIREKTPSKRPRIQSRLIWVKLSFFFVFVFQKKVSVRACKQSLDLETAVVG